jgi:hypothetical protein
MRETLEKRGLETSELHASVNDLWKKLTQRMEKGNEDLVNLRRGYKAKMQSKIERLVN